MKDLPLGRITDDDDDDDILYYITLHYNMGRRAIGIFRSLIWSKTLLEIIFNTCGEFRIFSDLLRSVPKIKREWDVESNGMLPYLFIPSKTAALFVI